jgi:hypothetical protein
MSLAGILLGLINIGIVIAILVLIGAIALWIASMLGFAVPALVQRLFMIIVALVALYMIVAMLLGYPVAHVIGHL